MNIGSLVNKVKSSWGGQPVDNLNNAGKSFGTGL